MVSNASGFKTCTDYHIHADICQLVEEQILPELSNRHLNVKFISIPSKNAIPNWPDENLPSLLCYRFGKLQSQLISLEEIFGGFVFANRLEWRLATIGVMQTELEMDPGEFISESQMTLLEKIANKSSDSQ